MEQFLHFALSHPVSTAVLGCDTIQQLEENVMFASHFMQMSEEHMKKLSGDISPFVRQLCISSQFM